MLIVNKKYSNLLEGYRRAIELDLQLEKEWETNYKPKISARLQDSVSSMKKKYHEDLLAWEKKEQVNIAQWETLEKEKNDSWEANEAIRQSEYFSTYAQYSYQITQHKQKTQKLMIAWICTSILFIVFFLQIVPMAKHNILLGYLCASITMFSFVSAVTTLILFAINKASTQKPLQDYQPSPKPQPIPRFSEKKPVEPKTAEEIINRQSRPNIVSKWMEQIQYQNRGLEYFRKLNQENPETANGILGEINLSKALSAFDNQTNPVVYIPGLKTQIKGDIDGIAIFNKGLWVLESKYLTGKVILHDGEWKQFNYIRHNGQPYLDGWEEKEFDNPFRPEDQLEKKQEKIEGALSKFLLKNPWIKKAIKGLLVFTHNGVDLDIANCRVPYIKEKDLGSFFSDYSDIEELTLEKRFEIADILLSLNRKIEKEEVSAVQLAEKIYEQSVEFLEKFSKSHCLLS